MLRTHNYTKKQFWKHLDGLLFVMFDEVDLTNRKNQWFYHIKICNKEHVIQPYNVTK